MQAHEYAALFPMGTDAEIEDMASDIKARGLLNPIITLDGKVLDGRNRLRACESAGVAPRFEKYDGSDPLGDVLSWNLHRRQMTPSQRAMVGAKLANMRQGERTDMEPSANLHKVSQADAARAVGVSPRLIADAKVIQEEDAKLAAKVESGGVTVNAAMGRIKRKRKKQAEKTGEQRPATFKTPEAEEAWYLKHGKQEDETEKEEKESSPKLKGIGVMCAGEAIAALQKIPPKDGLRREAWRMMRAWLDCNEKGVSR